VECIASIFRVEDLTKQVTNMKKATSRAVLVGYPGFLFSSEDRGTTFL
jgi:hypothetical protein